MAKSGENKWHPLKNDVGDFELSVFVDIRHQMVHIGKEICLLLI